LDVETCTKVLFSLDFVNHTVAANGKEAQCRAHPKEPEADLENMISSLMGMLKMLQNFGA
jgi:hypothetical protein